MQQQITTPPTTVTTPAGATAPALHLLAGLWVASCPTCGYQLTSARTQQRCERRASRRTCPVCHEEAS